MLWQKIRYVFDTLKASFIGYTCVFNVCSEAFFLSEVHGVMNIYIFQYQSRRNLNATAIIFSLN